MPATQKDIANKLNLSRSLVAGVLNARPGVWASDETRRRIFDAAHALDYRPNAAAKSLRTGKTNTVAFVYHCPQTDAQRQHYSGVVERIAEGAGRVGYRLLVSVQPDDESVLRFLTEMARSHSSDAFVLWGDEEDVEAQGELLERHGVPFVAKGRHEVKHPNWPQIDLGHEALMASAVRYLVDAGHRRIAYIGSRDRRIHVTCLRRGYEDAMQRATAGESPRPEWVAEIPTDDITSAERQMHRFLALPESNRPTALVIGANNAAWWGVERALHSRGSRIGFGPDDFAVAGLAWGHDILHRGEGMKFTDVSQNYLAEALVQSLLIPTLNGNPPTDPIVRPVPPLCRLGHIDLEAYHHQLLSELEMRPTARENIEA